MEYAALIPTVRKLWDTAVLPSLSEFVAVPALSPAFDAEWAQHGHLDAAVEHLRRWLTEHGPAGARAEVVRLAGRSPVLLLDVPPSGVPAGRAETVLLYGHLDKQPPMGGWSEGLGPWTPVVRDGRLYGRGAADDGYAGYAAATAIQAIQACGGAHSRCVVLLETGEESGSPDLPAYLGHLRERLGQVALVVCLDSGAQDYERMWLTTSLRGLLQVAVTVQVLESGQHSGVAGGVVPSSFQVLRALLDRLEDATTGRVLLPELYVEIPADRLAEAQQAVAVTPGLLRTAFPLVKGVHTLSEDDLELTLNSTWRPTLAVTGADGLPEPGQAGNVLRPQTTLCLSFRLPPTADSAAAREAVVRALTAAVPFAAQVRITRTESADGWNAPALAPWLRTALDTASHEVFGAPWRSMGMGGSIPFMGLLQAAYPRAQFVVTGALGPDSNAHVPDESLHLDYTAKLTTGVALILNAHARALDEQAE